MNALLYPGRRPSRPSNLSSVGKPSSHANDDLRSIHSSASSVNSNFSSPAENYKISRIETNSTVVSDYVPQARYKVSLNLSAKEISLLKYTWNKMLVEDEEAEQAPAAPYLTGSLWSQAKSTKAQAPSSRQVLGASSAFCSQLYSNLLAMDPELEVAFPSLRHQAVSMAGVLSLAVNSLDNLAGLEDYLVQLGKRHSRILGIQPAQFEMLGEAFVQTFHEKFGTRFSHDLEDLWIKFYSYLANTMIQFGMDPVLQIDAEPRSVRSGSVSESESEVSTMVSYRRTLSTDASSIMSARVPPKMKAKPLPEKPKAKVKKTRIGRKKGDCVVM